MNYFPSVGTSPMPSGLPVTGATMPTNPSIGITTHPVTPQIVQVVEHRMWVNISIFLP